MEWRQVVGYEGVYEVSEKGSVRRVKGGRGARPGLILKQQVDQQGYQEVSLHLNNRKQRSRVHALVAEAFIGRKKPGAMVNHLDGVKANCARSNLEWTTAGGNALHAHRTGLTKLPRYDRRKPPRAKLTYVQAMEIRASKENKWVLAERYGVTEYSIRNIRAGRTWSHGT